MHAFSQRVVSLRRARFDTASHTLVTRWHPSSIGHILTILGYLQYLSCQCTDLSSAAIAALTASLVVMNPSELNDEAILLN